ncbi:MAG: DUF4440 domain-containing protein [Candidatus Nomurabacteria bacterium]|nr:DUF4440 domain-containing protein [Candidatus Nomurabacteria bacterium]
MTDIEQKIYALEMSLLTPEVRSSAAKLDELLSDDFIEFGSSGLVYDKKHILERLPSNTDSVVYKVEDFNVKILSEDCALATFKTEKIVNDVLNSTSLRSSIWKKESENWRMFFHQGTHIK